MSRARCCSFTRSMIGMIAKLAYSTLRVQHAARGAGAIGEALYRSAERIEHRNGQVRHRAVFLVHQMLPSGETPAPTAGKNQWRVVGAVLVAIANAGAEEHHRVIEYVRFAFLHGAQLAEE